MEKIKKGATEVTPVVEDYQVQVLYAQLKDNSENDDDCTEIIQKIIDFSYANAISEAELARHLA